LATLPGYDDLKKWLWQNLRYERVFHIKEYLPTNETNKKRIARVNASISRLRAMAGAALNLI
jgi:hypothetical protein